MELKELDVTKCFVDDSYGFWDGFWERRNGLGAAPHSADPDSASATLRNYHQALWSRELPNGQVMKLEKGKNSDYLTWNGMRFASDSIATQHRYVNPHRLIRFREYRRGFQTPHGHSPMPATLGRSGYLTTDTAQTQ